MVTISRGDIWWTDLSEPTGSEPGYRRPVIVIQGDSINRSRISTVICVPLTSNMQWSDAPGNVSLSSKITGLPKDSVANVSQIITIDRNALVEPVGKLSLAKIELIFSGIDIVFGR
jgi:mRNA interferase MazF